MKTKEKKIIYIYIKGKRIEEINIVGVGVGRRRE